MKRIAFAWVTVYVDFTSRKEAERYALASKTKGCRILTCDDRYAYTDEDILDAVYENGNDEYKYTVKLEKPYRDYNMG